MKYGEYSRYLIHVYSVETWKKISVVPIKDNGGDIRTLCVNKHHVFLMCAITQYIFKISLERKEIVKYDQYGIELGQLKYSFACMCDDDDNLLIADMFNHRLRLLHGAQWSEVELQSSPIWPKDAVYDGHALYVLGLIPGQLFKYEAETVNTQYACVLM